MSRAAGDYKQRFVSSALAIIVLMAVFLLAPYPLFQPVFAFFVAGIAALALKEFSRLLRAKKIVVKPSLLYIWTFLAAFFLLLAAHYPYLYPFFVLFLPLVLTSLFWAHSKEPQGSLPQISYSIFMLLYISLPMLLMVEIVYGTPCDESRMTGIFWLIYLLVVTKATDMAALFVGRSFGRRKLCPAISPNKTVIGALGGLVGAILVSLSFALIAEALHKMFLSPLAAVIVGAVIGFVAEIGDLLESLFKRDAHVEDSSNILPGLGGVLDIVDSLLLTTPCVYVAMRILECASY